MDASGELTAAGARVRSGTGLAVHLATLRRQRIVLAVVTGAARPVWESGFHGGHTQRTVPSIRRLQRHQAG